MLDSNAKMIYKAQPGRQSEFLASEADFCLYGGAAGGGKTYGLILESLRYINEPDARVLVFMRQSVDLDNPGGLWDEMSSIYPDFGATSNKVDKLWTFPSGMKVKCAHLNHEEDKKNYKGSQLLVILFDELTHFTETQFWYMFSRARSKTRIRPYIRATTNPEPGWVADLISWYIGGDGLVAKDRACKVRYFVRDGDLTVWGSTKEELMSKGDYSIEDIKSFQFIPANIEDNQKLMQNGGREYIANLKLVGEVESKRLLDGNWKIRKDGKIFKQNDFLIFSRAPIDIDCKIIIVDTAQKEKERNDYSVLQCWVRKDNRIYLVSQVRGKFSYPDLKIMFLSFVEQNKKELHSVYVEDKVSGTSLIQDVKRECPVPLFAVQRSRDKYSRAYDVSGYVSAGHVYLNPMEDYYPVFISEVVAFGSEKVLHDDQCDCMFDAIEKLLINPIKPMLLTNQHYSLSQYVA